jgi:hypothetical protein
MNRMRTIGSRKISDTSDSDAYAPQRTAVVGGTSTYGRKMSTGMGRVGPETSVPAYPDTSALAMCDQVKFSAQATPTRRGTGCSEEPLLKLRCWQRPAMQVALRFIAALS